MVDEQHSAVISLDLQEHTLVALYPQMARQYRLHHATDLWCITKERMRVIQRYGRRPSSTPLTTLQSPLRRGARPAAHLWFALVE